MKVKSNFSLYSESRCFFFGTGLVFDHLRSVRIVVWHIEDLTDCVWESVFYES